MDKNKTYRNKRRRLPALLLAAVMALSTALGALPPAMLAGTADAAAAFDRTEGSVTILMTDSSVPGGDTDDGSLDLSDASKEWGVWATSLKTKDFLTSPQGLARMDGRRIVIYDMGEDYTFGGYVKQSELDNALSFKELTRGKGYVVEDFNAANGNDNSSIVISAKEAGLQAGHKYVVSQYLKNNASAQSGSYYGYMDNVEASGNGNIGWQLQLAWTAGANPVMAVNSSGKWNTTGFADGTVIIDTYKTQPLHNEVMRGGFSFSVMDQDTGNSKSQGLGTLEDSVFAVFNISTDAMPDNTYTSGSNDAPRPATVSGTGADHTTPSGYVTVDQNHDGKIEGNEATTFYPAYDVNAVIDAWHAYLMASAAAYRNDKSGLRAGVADYKIPYIEGLYGANDSSLASNPYALYTDDYNKSLGLFDLAGGTGSEAIVPCMILKPDANGVVSTGKLALPVGNYIVLQVKSGLGYYIDENFMPIVSIGPWGSSGYGNAYYGMIGTSINDAMQKNNMSKGVRDTTAMRVPVAFVDAQTSTPVVLSGATSFAITNTGGKVAINASTLGKLTNVYGDRDTYPSQAKYLINPNKEYGQAGETVSDNAKAVGARRNPILNRSRFNAYNTVVRAGVRFYLADSDDVLDTTAQTSADEKSYIVEPQGNGDLSGAVFTLYNNVDPTYLNQWTADGKTAYAHDQQMGATGSAGVLSYGAYTGRQYTAFYDEKSAKYVVQIDADDLPYGMYRLTQTATGKGYGHEYGDTSEWYAEDEVEYTLLYIGVARENDVMVFYKRGVDNLTGEPLVEDENGNAYALRDIVAKYRLPGHTDSSPAYLPQKLVSGGELLSVTARDATAADANIKVQIFNVSNYYVYVNKDLSPDKTEERFPTIQNTYNSRVKGKNLTPVQMKEIVTTDGAWQAACVFEWTGKVSEADMGLKQTAVDLPYGTYLIAITNLDDGYTVIGPSTQESSITAPGQVISWSVQIADKTMTPEISTVLVDTDYQIDSVPVKKEAGLTDQVNLSNLNPETNYIVYGVVVDKATGELLPGTGVSYTTASAYVPVDTGSDGGYMGGMNAQALVNSGEQFNTHAQRQTDAYGVWLYSVQDYAKGINDSMLTDLVNRGVSNFNSTNTSNYNYHDAIMARLKYLTGADATDGILKGTAFVDLTYPHIDTTKLEGVTAVGYAFVCEGTEPNPLILRCKTVGELLAASDSTLRAMHRNLGDEAQTAYIPSLDIEARASYTAGKTLDPTETVTGTITYGNVEPGNDYRLVATLKDSYGKTIMKEGGKEPLTVTVDFRAKDVTGYEVVTFEGLDVAEYNGQRLTVYADLLRLVVTGTTNTPYWLVTKGDADSMGWKITDENPGRNQVDVLVPVVTTNLADRYGNKVVDFDARVTLIDRVHYTTLIPGEKYLSVLTLVDEDGKTLKDDSGKDLTAEKEFTAKKAEDDVDLSITFEGSNIQGAEVTAFNDLYHITADQKALVAFEHDLETPTQKITASGDQYKIHFTTSVKDDTTNTKYALLGASVSLTDSVTLRNLEPATKYVLKTEVAIAATGNVITQFEPIYTNVSTDNDGMAKLDVPFKMNTNPFRGQRLVVFQTLYDAKEVEVIASHCDRSDENQIFYVADIDTVLTGGNGRSKKVYPDLVEHEDVSNRTVNGELVTIVTKSYTYECELADQVYYSNLTPGNEYMLTTQIVSQDGKGTVATSNLKFTPMNPSGIVTVYLEMDVTDFMGKKVVAYETITDTYTNTIIASHQDLMDTDQTVDIVTAAEAMEDEPKPDDELTIDDPPAGEDPGSENPGKNTGKDIQTGVDEKFGLYFGIAGALAALAACGGGFYYWKRRRGSKQ